MNNKKFTLFAFIFIFHYAYSQSTYITATVKDTTTNTPLAYCSVIIKNASDSIIRSVYTDDNGNFEIGVNKNTQGKVIVSMVGYHSRTFKLEEARKWKKSTVIYLTPSVEQLKEITVTEQAAPVVRKFDKTVYTISDTLKKSAQNVYDILKTLPGVVVDEQTRTIRFKGGNPEVTVNNMPAQYVFPKLEMIKIDDIEAIELIDKASLYGGEGAEGIINIKIKTQPKMQRYGLFLSEETSYMPSKNKFPLNDHFIGVNAMMPLLIFNNLGYKQTLEGYDLYKTGTLTRSNDVFSLYNKSSLLSNDKKLFNYAGIALPSDMITVLLVYGIETNKINTNNQLYSNYNNNKSASLQWLTSTDKMAVKTTYYLGMLSFQTPKGHAFQFNYTRADEKGEDNLAANYRSMDTTEVTYPYSYFGKEAGKTELLQSFLAFMIKKNTRLNLHGSYFGSKMHNNERKYYINDVLYLPNSNAASGIQYRWKVGTNFGTRWNRLKLDATLDYIIDRIDMSYTRYTLQQDTILKVNRNIRAWSPSARLTYNPNKKDEFNAGYNFTNKPYMGEQALSFVDKQNPTEWKSGNPNLQPEYYHKIYSSFKHYTDSFNYSIELFYSLTQNGITNILYPIEPGVYLNRPENVVFNQRIGCNLSLLKQINKWIKVELNSSIYHSYYKANDLNEIAAYYGLESTKIIKNNYGGQLNFSISYRTLTSGKPGLYLWFRYNSKEINYTGYAKDYFDLDLAVSKRFFNDKFFINIAYGNLLKSFTIRKVYENYMNNNTYANKYIFENHAYINIYLYYFINDISTATKDLTPKMFQ